MSNAKNEENNMEMPAQAGNTEEVKMEVPSMADQINQTNNVLSEQNNQADTNTMTNQNPYMPQTPAPGSKPNPLNGIMEKIKTVDKKILYGVCGVVVVLLLFILLSGSGSKSAVNKFAKYYQKGDHKKIVELYHDDYKDNYYGDLKDTFKSKFKSLEDKDIKYKKFKILDTYKYPKDKVEDMAKSFEKLYDIDEDDIKGAYTYLVKFKVDYDGEDAFDYMLINVVKVKGKWYIFDNSSMLGSL